jgi:transposase-like protein
MPNSSKVPNWSPQRRASVVLRVLRRQMDAAEACEHYGIELQELSRWTCLFIMGGERALDDSSDLSVRESLAGGEMRES